MLTYLLNIEHINIIWSEFLKRLTRFFISQAGDSLQPRRHRAHTYKRVIWKRFLGNTAHRPWLSRLVQAAVRRYISTQLCFQWIQTVELSLPQRNIPLHSDSAGGRDGSSPPASILYESGNRRHWHRIRCTSNTHRGSSRSSGPSRSGSVQFVSIEFSSIQRAHTTAWATTQETMSAHSKRQSDATTNHV